LRCLFDTMDASDDIACTEANMIQPRRDAMNTSRPFLSAAAFEEALALIGLRMVPGLDLWSDALPLPRDIAEPERLRDPVRFLSTCGEPTAGGTAGLPGDFGALDFGVLLLL